MPCNVSMAWGLKFDPEDLNLTDQELRLKYLGPQQTELFVPICVTYLLIFVVGTVGNGLTCTVILHHRVMRTPTNYYLFSLAVSDLLVLLVGLPLELYEMWCNYPFLLGTGGCYFRTLLFETVCLASVLNVTALSMERYMAVVHPLQARSVVTRAHVRRVLGVIWGLAVLCSLPNTSLHGIWQLHVPCRGTVPDSAMCKLVYPLALYNLVIQITTLLFFCLPMAIISVLYLLIGLQLRQERLLLLRQGPSDRRRLQRLTDRGRTQVTKMLCKCCRWKEGLTQALGMRLGLPGPGGRGGVSGFLMEAESEAWSHTPHLVFACVHAGMDTLFNDPSRNSHQRSMLMAHGTINYIICGAQCKMKSETPCSKIIKNVKTTTVEH